MPVPQWRREADLLEVPEVQITVQVTIPAWDQTAGHRYTVFGSAGRCAPFAIRKEVEYGAAKALRECINRAAQAAFPEPPKETA